MTAATLVAEAAPGAHRHAVSLVHVLTIFAFLEDLQGIVAASVLHPAALVERPNAHVSRHCFAMRRCKILPVFRAAPVLTQSLTVTSPDPSSMHR